MNPHPQHRFLAEEYNDALSFSVSLECTYSILVVKESQRKVKEKYFRCSCVTRCRLLEPLSTQSFSSLFHSCFVCFVLFWTCYISRSPQR